MKVKIHLWVLKFDDGYSHALSENDRQVITLIGKRGDRDQLFYGAANHLQAWAAKREIPYQHLVLNVPVELEI